MEGVFRHYYFFLDGTLGKNVVVVSVFFYRVIWKWCATQAVIFTILWLTMKNQLKDCGILYTYNRGRCFLVWDNNDYKY